MSIIRRYIDTAAEAAQAVRELEALAKHVAALIDLAETEGMRCGLKITAIRSDLPKVRVKITWPEKVDEDPEPLPGGARTCVTCRHGKFRQSTEPAPERCEKCGSSGGPLWEPDPLAIPEPFDRARHPEGPWGKDAQS